MGLKKLKNKIKKNRKRQKEEGRKCKVDMSIDNMHDDVPFNTITLILEGIKNIKDFIIKWIKTILGINKLIKKEKKDKKLNKKINRNISLSSRFYRIFCGLTSVKAKQLV